MKKQDRHFQVVDWLLIAMIVLPLVAGMVLQVLTKPASEGISITGARIFFEIPMPLMPMLITEAQINSWLIMITIVGICLYMTHGIRAGVETKRQMAAEWAVEKVEGLVLGNMDPVFHATYGPFIAAILALSALSSLSSMLGLFPPTADVNVVAGWSILVFILITKNKLKTGLGAYLKGYLSPIFIMLPMNIIGEVATPVSMAMRHYGNVLSGTVISTLVAAGLTVVSNAVLGWLPGFLGEFPLLRIGLPAVLSVYFDIFSSCMQAFIFAILTVLNITGAYPGTDEIEAFRAKKRKAA